MKMKGLPLNLNMYEASETLTNKHFQEFKMSEFERIHLPDSMRPFTDLVPKGTKEFVVDDNRGAVSTSPYMEIDGTDFYLSVKGIGSTTNPFSHQLLGKAEVCNLLKDSALKDRIVNSRETVPRYLTGELWLRGSPYGGQGLQHATTSMRVSEMADLTSIHGFRVAPLVKILFLPESLENEIKKIYWYRRFRGRMVQEARLVPSNVRIYFHSGSTIGGNISSVFDLFGIDENAVLSPEGTIYFVDLEGLEWITIGREKVREKIDDQIYRSLYEFIYAYEQIERERSARFGDVTDRKVQFEHLLRQALKDDEVIKLAREGESLELVVGNILGEQSVIGKFPIIDW